MAMANREVAMLKGERLILTSAEWGVLEWLGTDDEVRAVTMVRVIDEGERFAIFGVRGQWMHERCFYRLLAGLDGRGLVRFKPPEHGGPLARITERGRRALKGGQGDG